MTEGVKQGCPLSPTLFWLFFDCLESYLHSALATAPAHVQQSILRLGPLTIALLLFADDLVLASTSPAGL